MLKCPYCEAPLEAGLSECPNCHESIRYVQKSAPEAAEASQSAPQTVQFVKKNTAGLSNGLKVFLSVLSTIFGLGQIVTFVASIVFICSNDSDKKSFGFCLLIATAILFILSLILAITLFVILSFNIYSASPYYYQW